MKPVRIAFPFWNPQGCQIRQNFQQFITTKNLIMTLPITTKQRHRETITLWKWGDTLLKEVCVGYELWTLPTHFRHLCCFLLSQLRPPQGRNAAAAVRFRSSPKTCHPRPIHFHLRHCFWSSPICLENHGHGIPGHPVFFLVFLFFWLQLTKLNSL